MRAKSAIRRMIFLPVVVRLAQLPWAPRGIPLALGGGGSNVGPLRSMHAPALRATAQYKRGTCARALPTKGAR
jgi:hypothetical protein